MEKPRDPIMEEIESLKKIKTLFLTTTIVGIIFVLILKEIALMFIMISIPLAFLAFIIALFAIIIVNSDPLEKADEILHFIYSETIFTSTIIVQHP